MTVYKSKFGYEIVAFLILLFGAIIGFMIFQSEPLKAILIVGVIVLLVLLFFIYLNFYTEYSITNDGFLKIKCGFLYSKKFNIKKIKSIHKTSNLISSPAPSLDRIELTYNKFDSIIISPKDKISFANNLTKINPEIENKLV